MDPERLLIIHQGALGDFIVTCPALALLGETYPVIDLLAAGAHGRLAARQLGLARQWFPLESARIIPLFAGETDPHIRDLFSPYGTVLLFSFSQHLERNIRRITEARICRIPPRPDPGERIHVAEHLVNGLKGCGLVDASRMFDPAVFRWRIPAKSDAAAKDPPPILIHPGAGSPRKMWPLSRFLQVAAHLRSKGFRPEFLLGPAEMSLSGELTMSRRDWTTVHTPRDLTELVTVLRSAGGFIGNDSGVSHLAAFLGLPTVAVFGPSDPVRWRPPGPAVEVVRPELDCEPCFETKPENCKGEDCLDQITAEMVIRAFERIADGEKGIGPKTKIQQPIKRRALSVKRNRADAG